MNICEKTVENAKASVVYACVYACVHQRVRWISFDADLVSASQRTFDVTDTATAPTALMNITAVSA